MLAGTLLAAGATFLSDAHPPARPVWQELGLLALQRPGPPVGLNLPPGRGTRGPVKGALGREAGSVNVSEAFSDLAVGLVEQLQAAAGKLGSSVAPLSAEVSPPTVAAAADCAVDGGDGGAGAAVAAAAKLEEMTKRLRLAEQRLVLAEQRSVPQLPPCSSLPL